MGLHLIVVMHFLFFFLFFFLFIFFFLFSFFWVGCYIGNFFGASITFVIRVVNLFLCGKNCMPIFYFNKHEKYGQLVYLFSLPFLLSHAPPSCARPAPIFLPIQNIGDTNLIIFQIKSLSKKILMQRKHTHTHIQTNTQHPATHHHHQLPPPQLLY